mgnify:CR=1 FL=1
MKLREFYRFLKSKTFKKEYVTVIPFKVENSVALFALINSQKFISGTKKGKETPVETAEREFFLQTGARCVRSIKLLDNAFAFECPDLVSSKVVWLEYEEALEKLSNQLDKELLKELFYKPQPL